MSEKPAAAERVSEKPVGPAGARTRTAAAEWVSEKPAGACGCRLDEARWGRVRVAEEARWHSGAPHDCRRFERSEFPGSSF